MLAQWFLWRLALPLAIVGIVAYVTWGAEFFEVYTALLWTTFLGHLVVTIAFSRTHILDTGSYLYLLICFHAFAEISEARGYRSPDYWVFAAATFTLLCALLVDRPRACSAARCFGVAKVDRCC